MPLPPKLAGAVASALTVAAGFALLVFGLDLRAPAPAPQAALVAIVATRNPPPPPRDPPRERPRKPSREPRSRKTSDAAPAAMAGESGRTGGPVLAPLPKLVPTRPPMPSAAPTGGSEARGTGRGAGEGRGGGPGRAPGGDEGGEGTGANSGVATFPRQLAGRMHYSDLPEDLRKSRSGAEITVRYRIGTDGRVSGCTVVSSSGRPDLDAATCDHISRRFRFRPARDAAGHSVPFVMTETQGWDNSAR